MAEMDELYDHEDESADELPVQRPGPYTVMIALLVLAMTAYAIGNRDPLGYVMLFVVVVFVAAPAGIILVLSRRERGRASR